MFTKREMMAAVVAMATLSPCMSVPVLANPPDPGTEDYDLMHGSEDWITRQYNVRGYWCCDISDGRPLHGDEIRVVEGGKYQIFFSKKHWRDGTDEWVDVAADVILKQPRPIGVPLAWARYSVGDHTVHVYCLALSGGF